MWDYTTIKEQAEQVSDYWVWAHSRGVFEISWFLRGFENFMLDLETNEVLACAIMDRIEAYLYERTKHILEAADGLIDMVEYNDDVGGQYGMLISPKCFRKHLKPRMKRFVDLCKNHGAVVRYHSCGSIRAILEDCIEIGIDVINPVQTGAAEMDPAGLKRDFGPRITFNGGIDTEELLPRASYQEVRDEVARLIGIFGKGGGYILSPSHAFQADVPVENVLAVYETALGKRLL
jgi:uroporphyrinogen decarboxylase